MNKLTPITILLVLFFAQPSCPQKFPTQAEIYDFNPGDEFHTLHYFCYNPQSFQLEQMNVLKRAVDSNGLYYVVEKSVFDFLSTSPPVLCDTSIFCQLDTLKVEYPDSVIFTENDSMIIDPGLYNGRRTYIHSYWLLNDIKVERYTLGCGMVFNGWIVPVGSTCSVVDSLIYFSKGNETWGSSLLSTGAVRESAFRVFPNPAGDYLYIQSNGPENPVLQLAICDPSGKRIGVWDPKNFGNTLNTSIHLGHFRPGLYFLYIRTGKGTFSYKFVKN